MVTRILCALILAPVLVVGIAVLGILALLSEGLRTLLWLLSEAWMTLVPEEEPHE